MLRLAEEDGANEVGELEDEFADLGIGLGGGLGSPTRLEFGITRMVGVVNNSRSLSAYGGPFVPLVLFGRGHGFVFIIATPFEVRFAWPVFEHFTVWMTEVFDTGDYL